MSARQQVRVPRLPEAHDRSGGTRERPMTSVVDSYERTIVRIQRAGHVVDIVPVVAGAADPPDTAPHVDRAVGADPGPVHVIAGSHGSGEDSTPQEDARATLELHRALDRRGWAWDPAAVFLPGREWPQTAAAVRAVSLDEVRELSWRLSDIASGWPRSRVVNHRPSSGAPGEGRVDAVPPRPQASSPNVGTPGPPPTPRSGASHVTPAPQMVPRHARDTPKRHRATRHPGL